jgi:ADYC domain
LRIDAVEKDPLDADGEVLLYETSVRDPVRGDWKPFCLPDRDGKNRAIPLRGSWDASRQHVASTTLVTFACTNGAIGKCVRLGYKPWKTVHGVSLADYHQACVHMVPADYCGSGRAHTRDGTLIGVYDRLGIHKRTPAAGMVFEAAWSPRGAAYLSRPRYGGEKLDELVAECPHRLRGRTGTDGPTLDPSAVMDRWPDALIISESRVTDERP